VVQTNNSYLLAVLSLLRARYYFARAWGAKKLAGKPEKTAHSKPARCRGDVKYSEDARGAKGAN